MAGIRESLVESVRLKFAQVLSVNKQMAQSPRSIMPYGLKHLVFEVIIVIQYLLSQASKWGKNMAW